MVDSYESFFDEYVDFMKRYSTSDDALSMLNEYLDYMQKYTEYMGKLDELAEYDMNEAESAYYLAATLRIEQKLLSIY